MIGKRIKEKRLEMKMTLEEVAEAVGSTRQTIHRYENGEISNIPSDKIEKIAKVLKTSPSSLMGWSNEVTKGSYGDHQANLEHLAEKPDLLEIYNEIYENETLQLLFDSAKNLTPQDLEMVLTIIKGIKKEREQN